jgi:hypothetical protein
LFDRFSVTFEALLDDRPAGQPFDGKGQAKYARPLALSRLERVS